MIDILSHAQIQKPFWNNEITFDLIYCSKESRMIQPPFFCDNQVLTIHYTEHTHTHEHEPNTFVYDKFIYCINCVFLLLPKADKITRSNSCFWICDIEKWHLVVKTQGDNIALWKKRLLLRKLWSQFHRKMYWIWKVPNEFGVEKTITFNGSQIDLRLNR